jgi:hypothetical protein
MQGVLYTIHNFTCPHGCCRKMSRMQQEEAILSRWQFLKLCVAAMAGLSLLSFPACGGSQGGGEGRDGNGNGTKDNQDGGGGGAGGGY